MTTINKSTSTWGGKDYEPGDVIKHVNFEREWEVQGHTDAGQLVVKAADTDALLVLSGAGHRYWEVVKARRIRTAEGARKYGKPIGSTIGGGGAPKMDRSLASGAGKGEAPEAAREKDERRARAIDRDRKADAEGDKRTKEREDKLRGDTKGPSGDARAEELMDTILEDVDEDDPTKIGENAEAAWQEMSEKDQELVISELKRFGTDYHKKLIFQLRHGIEGKPKKEKEWWDADGYDLRAPGGPWFQ